MMRARMFALLLSRLEGVVTMVIYDYSHL